MLRRINGKLTKKIVSVEFWENFGVNPSLIILPMENGSN